MQGRGDVSARAGDGDLQTAFLLEVVKALFTAVTVVIAVRLFPLNIQKQELDVAKGRREESKEQELERNDENVRSRRPRAIFFVGAACSVAALW